MKEKYEKPELVILLRGRPEEVLTNNCKVAQGLPAPGNPQVDNNGCGLDGVNNCKNCAARSGGGS